MSDNITRIAVYNVNRAMQEMRLNAQRIDEAIEDLEDHKKILEHNLSVAEESIKALYNVIDGKNNSNEFSTQEV